MIQFIAFYIAMLHLSQGCDPAGLHVQAEVRATGAGGCGLLPPVLGRDGLHQRGAGQQALQVSQCEGDHLKLLE